MGNAASRCVLFLLLIAAAIPGQGQSPQIPAIVGSNRPLYVQAWTAYLQGDYDRALQVAERGLEEDRQAGRQAGVAEALNLIGTVHYKRGEYDRALALYQQAAESAESAHYTFGLGRDWSSLGSTYYRQGQYRLAKSYYERSLQVRQKLGDRDELARALNDLANVYQQLGDYAQALTLRRRALRLWRQAGDAVGVADALNDIAWTYEDMGRYPDALRTLGSLTQYARLHHQWGEADTLESVGRVEGKMGRYTDALLHLQDAYRRFTALGARDEMARAASDLGDLYLHMGNPAQAIAQYQGALRLELVVNDRPVEGATLAGLMQAWLAERNPVLAVFYGKQAVNLFQEIRGDVRAFDPSLGRSFLRSKEKTYRDLAELLTAQGRLPEAEQVLNMLKEEEYFNFIQRDAEAAASLNGRASLTAKEAEGDQRYREISGRLAALGREYGELREKTKRTPEEEQRLAQLESNLSAASAAFDKFLDGLAGDFPAGAQAQARVFELRELQGLMEDLRELGPGAVVLYTIVGPDKVRIILVTPDVELARESTLSSADLARKVLALRRAMQDPDADPRPLAQDLYRVLLGPVAADLEQAQAHTLMWSLDGVLRYLPLAALYDGHQYLVERYANVLITPASYARLKDAPASRATGLGLGVSKSYGGFPALAAVPKELEGIIEAPGEHGGVIPGTILLDNAFTAETFRQELRRRYTIVHVASHFFLAPGDDANSFLLLGDGSHLALSDIEHASNLFGGVDLLTLSACNTMMGAGDGDGREVEGFGILAQRQGAKAVLATLWPVADASTQMLMRQFYREMEAQPAQTKAEALRRAQIALLHGAIAPAAPVARRTKSRARGMAQVPETSGVGTYLPPPFEPDPHAPFAHPYYWAPFVIIGNWK